MFGPTSIKVYDRNHGGANRTSGFFAFYRRPIKLVLDARYSILDVGCVDAGVDGAVRNGKFDGGNRRAV